MVGSCNFKETNVTKLARVKEAKQEVMQIANKERDLQIGLVTVIQEDHSL